MATDSVYRMRNLFRAVLASADRAYAKRMMKQSDYKFVRQLAYGQWVKRRVGLSAQEDRPS